MAKKKRFRGFTDGLFVVDIEAEESFQTIAYGSGLGFRQKIADWLNKHWPEQPQWISVEDELPEDNVTVAVFLPGDLLNKGVGAYCDGRWLWSARFGFGGKEGVTHWMPLEPPEERPPEEQPLHRAELYGSFICPSCHLLMTRDNKERTIYCLSEDCDLYGIRWEIPTFELVERWRYDDQDD